MPEPTLLIRGSIVTKDINIKNQIPRDYIIQRLTDQSKIKHKIFVIKSGTGSGKSTVLPSSVFLSPNNNKRVAVTEISRATAEEIPYDIISRSKGTFEMGENIGFQTGLINKAPSKGKSLIFMTVGVLYMHIISYKPEQFMRKYSYIFIDEVHKYDLMTDMMLKEIKRFYTAHANNPECPIFVLMSATLDQEELLNYFGMPPTQYIEVEGAKGNKIEEVWPSTTVANTFASIAQICKANKGKEIIVFCPTSKYISDLNRFLSNDDTNIPVIEILSKTIAQGDVKQLFTKSKNGRIILATNAVETGLTLPHLDIIIDTGLHFSVSFNPQYNANVRTLAAITKASAMQRRGRVGRVNPGTWYPLYTKDTFEAMLPQNYAEMYTTHDISKTILNMIATHQEPEMEVTSTLKSGKTKTFTTKRDFDPATLGMIHNPTSESWQYTFQELYQAGFINGDWKLTASGWFATKFRKLNTQQCRMILSAIYYQIPPAIALLSAAILASGGGYVPSDNILYKESDIINHILWFIKFKQTTEKKSMNWTREWCDNNKVNYEKMINTIELFYEILFESNAAGIKAPLDPLLLEDSFDRKNLKRAIYEGFRSNLMIWNDYLNSYVTNYKNNKIGFSRRSHVQPVNNFAITNEIACVGSQSFETGDFITLLDDIQDTIDLLFI
jgi:HrpA-like RNA helicase